MDTLTILNPLPSGERVARRAGEGVARFRHVRHKRNPLTLTLSPLSADQRSACRVSANFVCA
ncbi:hypothetical protein GAY33_25485 [Azospirillum brasilense]|uniref:Uncharacterized protein n=1 Tax=Azospirillum argentinense TaxID=2970906 RepID=A0A2K1G0M7_9PROT|nr:hypothetical protein [Azospirillum argentinense]PNQ98342.1 hypothetical protein C1S70_14305 [Azospirillum argentinense]